MRAPEGVVGPRPRDKRCHGRARVGFEQHGLPCIISVTAAAHAAARRVMEKAGLTYRGTRDWTNPEVPVVWYAVKGAAWKASKSEANTTRARATTRTGIE